MTTLVSTTTTVPAPASDTLSATTPMHAMTGMSATFSSSTHVTLWFSDWTTTSPTTYFLAVFFLFALGMLNRFLGALKSQLDTKWKAHPDIVEQRASREKSVTETVRGHARGWSRALRQQSAPVRLVDQEGHEMEPLSPTTQSEAESAKPPPTSNKRFWIASAPWSAKRDGIGAVLEFTRALLGYTLYVLFHIVCMK